MFSWSFQKSFVVAAIIFLVAGSISLYAQQPAWLIVPFGWILIQPLTSLVVDQTYRLFYVLLFLLPLSTEYNITPSLGIDFPDELLMMLLTGLFLLHLVHSPSSFPRVFLYLPLCLLLLVQILWMIASCFFSTDSLLSAKFVLAKVWFIVPFVIMPANIIRDKSDFKRMATCLLAPMCFVVLQSLVRHAFYGFSFEGVKNTLSPFFRNHVMYSSMLVCLIPVLVASLKFSTGATKRGLKALLVMAFIGVVFSYSRGAWLALFCGAVAALAFYFNRMKWLLIATAALAVVLVGSLAYQGNYQKFAPDYNSTVFHEDIGAHLQATVQLKDVSNAERLYRWLAAANMIAEKPLTGFGPNTFYNNYKSYTEQKFKTWVSDNPEHSTVHNYFLLVLVEQGLPGFILFVALLVGMLLQAQSLFQRIEDTFYKSIALTVGVTLSMIAFLICSSDLVETDKIGSLFWLCLGILIVLSKHVPKQSSSTIS